MLFSIELSDSIEKTPPNGVVVSMIFGMKNHRYPSHYDFLFEYQYEKTKEPDARGTCTGMVKYRESPKYRIGVNHHL